MRPDQTVGGLSSLTSLVARASSIDGVEVPVSGPSEWVDITEAWLANRFTDELGEGGVAVQLGCRSDDAGERLDEGEPVGRGPWGCALRGCAASGRRRRRRRRLPARSRAYAPRYSEGSEVPA